MKSLDNKLKTTELSIKILQNELSESKTLKTNFLLRHILWAHGLVAMTIALHAIDRRFESGWAHFASVVEWYNMTLPTLWSGSDSPSMHISIMHDGKIIQ